MKPTFSLLILVFTLFTSCDDEIFRDGARPEVRINWLNKAQIESENAIGDTVNVELALEFVNMPNMYFVDFKVHFDHTLFNPDSFDYQIFPSFFSTGGEVLSPDVDGDDTYDPSDGDQYNDSNGNGQWDGPTRYPIGVVRLETINTGYFEDFEDSNNNGKYDYGENFQDDNGNFAWDDSLEVYFSGALGIPSPENAVPSNTYGTAQVCKFYLSGIYTTTTFDAEIIQALEFQDANTDPEQLSVSNWEYSSLYLSEPNEPVLRMQQQDSEENSVVVSIEIGDSPKLSRFQKTIKYDADLLSYTNFEMKDFFDLSYYNYPPPIIDDVEGEITIILEHINANQNSFGVDETTFSEGTGTILDLKFLVASPDSSTAMITIPSDSVSAHSYNFSIGESYPLDMNFWKIEDSLQVDF